MADTGVTPAVEPGGIPDRAYPKSRSLAEALSQHKELPTENPTPAARESRCCDSARDGRGPEAGAATCLDARCMARARCGESVPEVSCRPARGRRCARRSCVQATTTFQRRRSAARET